MTTAITIDGSCCLAEVGQMRSRCVEPLRAQQEHNVSIAGPQQSAVTIEELMVALGEELEP
ncbi:MAG: hypothetical protein ACR2PK_10585 [Acidimicrobiales bacterium]